MGANPWAHFTPYQADINAALQSLKEQEFRAGRYGFENWHDQMISAMAALGAATDVTAGFNWGMGQERPSADALIEQHGSVQAAMAAILEESSDSGTMSVLDMMDVSEYPDLCAACPLSEEEFLVIFQTAQPSHRMIESILLNEEDQEGQGWEIFWNSIGRGEGRYIIVYEDAQPTELFFAGYSVD
jgi:hypothetical protein